MVSKGVVSNYSVSNGYVVLQTDAKIWFGNSGGGLFDENNKLVGIASSAYRMVRDDGTFEQIYGQYIPLSTIKTFLGE